MPYPNEHSCRMHAPDLYKKGSFRRIKRGDLTIIIGRRKGKTTTEAQAYRYPVKKWTEKKARAHCKEEGGKFEAAEEEKAMPEFDAVEVDGIEVSLEELVAVYKTTSLDQQSSQVRNAWNAMFRKPSVPGPVSEDQYWVKEVFDDQVIVETAEGLYAYPYTINADGEIEFGTPVKVEVIFRPVAAEKALAAVKMLREEDGGAVVGGHLLLWGSAEAKDLQGEYFTPETELMLGHYKNAPALFHHGLDLAVGLAVMGHRVKAAPDEVGVWVEDWLDTSSEYWQFVEPLLAAEVLYYSPGSAPHLVKRAEDGRLLSYPVVEDTLTVVPAQHRLRSVEQIKAAYKAAGLELPEGLEPAEPEGDRDAAGAVCPEAMKVLVRAEELLVEIVSTDENG